MEWTVRKVTSASHLTKDSVGWSLACCNVETLLQLACFATEFFEQLRTQCVTSNITRRQMLEDDGSFRFHFAFRTLDIHRLSHSGHISC
jgi:hypothetical protein